MSSKWEMIPPSDDYKYPQNMPESLTEVKENMKRRPYYCYRIFVNNVNSYISREIAKFFNGEYFLTTEIMEAMKTKPKLPEDRIEIEEPHERGSKKKERRKSKKRSRSGSRRSSKRSSEKRRSSKRRSRASKSSGKRKSRSSSKKRSSKRPSKSEGKRKSKNRASASQSRKQTSAGKRRSTKEKRGTKTKVPMRPASPEVVERLIEDLWPKFRRMKSTFTKLYDWDVDYPFLEDLRLLSKEQIGFDIERAKQIHSEPFEWDEDFKRQMKEKAWMYTRCVPPCGGMLTTDDDLPFTPEFYLEGPYVSGAAGGDTLTQTGKTPTRNWDYLKPNVVDKVKEYRDKLWKEDKGEKSLNFYNEDLFWGYPVHQVVATRTASLAEGELPPYYIFESINNIKREEDYLRDVYPCMIQMYDITKSPNCIEEAKMALDSLIIELKKYSEDNRVRNQALYGIHTFIVISPLLTWAETRTLAQQPQDVLREEYFWKRIPHPKYKKHWEFENYVYEKAYEYRDLLKIAIIGVGLVYGNGDHDLKPYYELARKNISPVLHIGRGFNIVPLIHIEDLARLCLKLTREWPSYTRYIIAAEKQFLSCREIMEIIANNIAEGYMNTVPSCFGKAVGIEGEDVHSLLYNEFKFNCTYLHDIIKHEFKHDFKNDILKTFAQYEKDQGYKPVRIVLFGPSDADQRKIGEEIAAHYQVPYINGFRAVKIFLKILLDLQNRVLDACIQKPLPKSWKLVEGKNAFFEFKISAPLAWHRQNRLLFRRDPRLEEINLGYKVETTRKDIESCKVADLPKPDFFETESLNKAEPENQKYKEAKEHLLNFDRLKQNGADLLGTLIRIDMQALIVHELLKFPICKNNGYVLDGLPTSEEEAEIIFSKGGTAPPKMSIAAAPTNTTGTRGTTASAASFTKGKPINVPPQSTATRPVDDYEYLPNYVFHIKKSEKEAFRDLTKGEHVSTFQKEFMAHFRRMQTHKLIMTKNRSALDFFEDKFNMITYCFDSGATSSDEIIQNIITMVDQGSTIPDPLDKSVSEPTANLPNPNDLDYIKQKLGVYSEDDYINKGFESTDKLSEIQFGPKKAALSQEQIEVDIPLSQQAFSHEEIEEAKRLEQKMTSEIVKLPDRALGFIHYLNKFVSKSIIKATTDEAAIKKPQDLIDWTAFHLMANNEGGKMPVEKIIVPAPRTNLSEYPFYEDKFDRKYVAHLE